MRYFSALRRLGNPRPGPQGISHDDLTCMFFVICDRKPTIWNDANVEITDFLEVTFTWE